jgi:hypothetical protein
MHSAVFVGGLGRRLFDYAVAGVLGTARVPLMPGKRNRRCGARLSTWSRGASCFPDGSGCSRKRRG